MTQPPSNSTLDPYSSSGSSARPSLGSFELISESQYHRDQGGGYGSNGGHMAVPESTEQFHPYMNLPSNVKLPPSYKQSEYPQEYRVPAQPPRPAPRTSMPPLQPPSVTVGAGGHAHTGGGVTHPGHSIETGVPVSEVVRQLDFAASENLRLRERLEYNNEVLDRKLQEIESLLRQKETENQRMEKTVEEKEKERQEVVTNASEATQKFFEARVAVMGFKSRQMQLQGEVEGLRAEIARKNSGVQSSGAGAAAPVGTTLQELDALKRENQQLQIEKQDLLGRLQNGGIKEVDHAVEELRRQLSKLKQDKGSLELNMTAVIDELQKDITGLQDKRNLDKDEIQRIKASATELQQRVWSFQQENGALRNQLGQQQVEMQRNIDSLQNELMATKQQQFYQASSEVSQLRTNLQDSQSRISQLTAELGLNQAENITLKGELESVKTRNTALLEKVNELKQMNDTFGQKLRQHSGPVTLATTTPPGSPPTPVKIKTAPIPKPRTNLQPVSTLQMEQLERQKSDLEREKSVLSDQLQRVSKLRDTAESELRHSTTRVQQMIEENIRLKQSEQEKDGMLSGQGEQVRRLEEEIRRLRERDSVLSSQGEQVRRLEQENRRLELQLKDAPSPGQLRQQQEQDATIQHLGRVKSELQNRVAALERDLGIKLELEVEVQSLRSERAQTAELQFEMRRERAQKNELESELSSLRRERTQKEEELSSLRRKNAELEGSVTQFQELEKAKKPAAGRFNPEAKLALRLSEALGLQKELEKRNENLEEEKKVLKDENDSILKELQQEKQKHDHVRRESDQLYQSFQQIKEEKARIEQEELQRAKSEGQALQEKIQALQEEIRSLRDELNTAVAEKGQYRTQIDRLRQDLTHKGDYERQVKDLREQREAFEVQLGELRGEKEELERQLSDYQQYQGQLDTDLQDKHSRIQKYEEKHQSLQAHYDQKLVEIEQLRSEIDNLRLANDDLRQQVDSSQLEIQSLSASVGQRQHSQQRLEAEVQKVRTENKELEGTVREFRNECEALMTDYQGSADRLHETESERDKYKNQYETALRELAQRAERIKQLEQQRKEATERNEHMSFQLKQYTEDFDRERTAREEAVKVKNIVEEQSVKKERELTSLRQLLNVHAKQQLKDEWDDPPQLGGDGGRSSPFTAPLGGGGGGGGGGMGMGHLPPGDQELHQRSRPQQDPPFEPPHQQPHPHDRLPPTRRYEPPDAFNRPPPPQPVRAWAPEQNAAGSGTFGAQDRPLNQLRHTQPHPPIPRAQPGVGGMHGPPPIQNQQSRELPILRAQPEGIRGQPGVMGGQPGVMGGQPGMMGGQPGMMGGQPGMMGGQPGVMGGIRGQPGMMGGIQLPAMPRRDPLQPAPAPRDDLGMFGGGGGGPWVAPGDVVNEKPPSMACPICNKADFRTQTDLEVHCAQCTASLLSS